MFLLKKSKIALSSNGDKRRQSIDLLETYVYETIKDLVSEKEIKCSNIIKGYKNDYIWWCFKRKHKKEHNLSWPQIPDDQ